MSLKIIIQFKLKVMRFFYLLYNDIELFTMSFEYFMENKIIFHGNKYKLLYFNLQSISIYLKIKLINKNNKVIMDL